MCLAIPGKVVEINNSDSLMISGKVEFGQVVKEISLMCLPDAQVGDYVIVHAGMALSIVDEVEAEKIFQLIAEIE